MIAPVTAAWLKADGLRTVQSNATAAPWGLSGIVSEIRCPLDVAADAIAEAQRQLDFLAGPLVIDVLEVAGARVDLVGKAITLRAAAAGYEAGATCFVVDAEERGDATTLRVLRDLS